MPDNEPKAVLPTSPKKSGFGVRLFLCCALITVGLLVWEIRRQYGSQHRPVSQPHDLSEWVNYNPPADQIVFFHDKSEFFGGSCTPEATSLMKSLQFDWNKSMVLCRDHSELDAYLGSVGAKRNVLDERDDESPSREDPWNPDAVLFCGGRACAAGERFVLVNSLDSGRWSPGGATKVFRFIADVYSIGSNRNTLVNVSSKPAVSDVGFLVNGPDDVVRIFAGQPDPVDRSHFTIGYSINDKKGVIDGNLQADGNGIIFSLHEGGPLRPIPGSRKFRQPASQPAPANIREERANWMRYKADPSQLVLLQDKETMYKGDLSDSEAIEAEALVKDNPDFVITYGSVAGRVNPGLDAFLTAEGTARTLPARAHDPGPLLYCGSRTCEAGERLVIVSFYCKWFFNNDPKSHESFGFSYDVFSSAGESAPLTKVSDGPNIHVGYYGSRGWQQVIRFFAGQPDPVDASHFTISYNMNGVNGIIDGTLQPDGKTVVLAARGGGPLIEKE